MTVDRKYWDRVKGFPSAGTVNGFDSEDLFIMNFIKKGWGQNIAAHGAS